MNNQAQTNQVQDQSAEDAEEQKRIDHFLSLGKEFEEDKTPIIESTLLFGIELKP